MVSSSKVYKQLKGLIEYYSSNIGPKDKLAILGESQYIFQDNLYYTDLYFSGGFLLREAVLSEIKNCKERTNPEFVKTLFDKITKAVYERIKKRGVSVDETLKRYLIEEDFIFAVEKLEEILKTSYKKLKIILVSDLIVLSDIEFCQIGNVIIKKVSKVYIDTLPKEIQGNKMFADTLFGSALSGPVNREEFFKEHEEHIVLEVEAEGYHLEDELSPVFDSAVQEIRLVFAYLFLCEHFSSNVIKESQFKIEKSAIKSGALFLQTESSGLQEYYLFDKSSPDFLKKLDTRLTKIVISDSVFVLSKDTIDRLRKLCRLDEFNKMNQRDDIGEMKNKINRSLDWFLKGILETNQTDEVISLFISLESLLATSPEYLTSHTDDMAENIAIMLTLDPNDRYNYKRTFKEEVYPLRNKIMHHGQIFSWDKDYANLGKLKTYVVWSTLGILERIDKITKYGNGSKAMREFFEREKLKPSAVFPPSKTENKV